MAVQIIWPFRSSKPQVGLPLHLCETIMLRRVTLITAMHLHCRLPHPPHLPQRPGAPYRGQDSHGLGAPPHPSASHTHPCHSVPPCVQGIDMLFILTKAYDIIIQREPGSTLGDAFGQFMATAGLSTQVSAPDPTFAFVWEVEWDVTV